jgi:DNA-directed RNA polymerase specialized sigma24 family protein
MESSFMSCDESAADHSVTQLIEQVKADAAVDADDVLVSVFDRFFRAAREDRFARLQDRDDLWQILLMLTERKAADQVRRAAAVKRGGNARASAGSDGEPTNVAQLSDPAPGPEFAAAFNDSLARAIGRLTDENTREVALLRMEGYENREIAGRLQISLSSVERKLRVIREVWQEEFAGGE